jgi:mannose-6-phosphate isomerase-like protein (cupin superfamily)
LVEAFKVRALDRDWGKEVVVAHTEHYLGKVLLMNAGTKGGLQYHVEKEETFFLFSGQALVRTGEDGKILETLMLPGQSMHVPPGAIHQVEAVTACVFFEASTPHFDDRVRVEEDFGLILPPGGLPTTRNRVTLT